MEEKELVEKFNAIVAKYDDPSIDLEDKIVLLNTVGDMVGSVPRQAFNDPEFSDVYKKLLDIYEQKMEFAKQQREEKIEQLVELGIEEIERLIDEHTIGFEKAPMTSYPVYQSTPEMRVTDNAELMNLLIEAKNRCESVKKM